MKNTVFEAFNNGNLKTPAAAVSFADIPWAKHAAYEGVALKHLVTAKDTDGRFSYHLVQIEPGKSIENHIHETQLETHEVIAGRWHLHQSRRRDFLLRWNDFDHAGRHST